MPVHAVLIATLDRTNLLVRALKSISIQTCKPDRIVIVDDSREPDIEALERIGTEFDLNLEILANRRTVGASGAWNTGLDHLVRQVSDPYNIIVSILDDDDWWEPDYLHHVSASFDTDIEVVAGELIRHDESSPEGRLIAAPNALLADDFLVGNPGIQGSNLSLRLSTLLQAGLFDEALASCTDRDLCIRLADLGARYRAAPRAIAHHDCIHGAVRLSDPTCKAKCQGLETFHAKWRLRMTSKQYEASTKRALRLFGWAPAVNKSAAPNAVPSLVYPSAPDPLVLVVGIIVDGNNAQRCLPLIDGLAPLAGHSFVDSFDIVLLENGDADGFSKVLDHVKALGLGVWPIEIDEQLSAVPFLPLTEADITRRKSIAVSRTLLQRFVYEVSQVRKSASVWILDDDFRVSTELDDLIAALISCRDSSIDVALGGNSGAAPVPASSLLRTQLVDLVHLLTWSSQRRADEQFPDAKKLNLRWSSGRRDVHYDLSRWESDRLEIPFLPDLPPMSLADGVTCVLQRAERIFAGEPITRAVAEMPVCQPEAARASCWRGGNTFITDATLLRDIPNMAPRVNGRPTRRSDMIWAANVLHRFGKSIKAFRIPMYHDRASEQPDEDDTHRLVDDILGYGFFTAYDEVLMNRTGTLPFTDVERQRVHRLTRKYTTERLAAYRLSFWRVIGLERALDRLVENEPWWLLEARPGFNRFRKLLAQTAEISHLMRVEICVEAGLARGEFDEFLNDMDRIQPELAAQQFPFFRDWVCAGREALAGALIAKRLERKNLVLLGMGSEGVVVRTDQRVVKVFDRWTPSERQKGVSILSELMTAPTGGALPNLIAIHEWPEALAVEYHFEESSPYLGGEGPALVAMLRDLRHRGWVHNNLSPKNLRLTRHGLQLIDVGKSLERATPHGEEMMIRRAFLSWRFAQRDDLMELMRRSLVTESLAELTGWRTLLEAVVKRSSKQRLDRFIRCYVERHQPQTILDYGCGKPRDVAEWTNGLRLTAFDIDPSLYARWRQDTSHNRFWGVKEMEAGLAEAETFDLVLCSLVLCVVDDTTMASILGNLRRLVAMQGRAIVAVCDPTALHVTHAVDQTRFGTADLDPAMPTTYHKCVGEATDQRVEFHRSVEAYRRAFARAGLRVLEEHPIGGYDANRLERVPEFLTFELAPLPDLTVRTSLLIKLCAMEAETASHQVRHLASQLGRPRAFDEVVLLIDPYQGPFPRAHSPANLSKLRVAAARLKAEGIVDRIVEGVTDGIAAAKAAQLWTDCYAYHAHTVNGQPATAILTAMEGCLGDYILHVDADVLIARPDPDFDHIANTVDVLEKKPDAVTLALSVYRDCDPLPRCESVHGVPYRVEAICGWVSKDRLIAMCPFEGGVQAGRLNLPWHRMLDLSVRHKKAASLRRGSNALWFASLDNLTKVRAEFMDVVMGRMEAGHVPALQAGRPLISGSISDWLGPVRHESMVVIISGRNVRPGAVNRCFASLRAQFHQDWGAIVIDDASDEPCREAIRRECRPFGSRITVLRRHNRKGLLANIVLAVRELVQLSDTVIVLLDLDDALADHKALGTVAAAHSEGADLTVGSMLRTDKAAFYPVDFLDPRNKRGGNVWQHLRTFRKSLFDRIRSSDLKLQGEWIELANDWAYMLPMVEMAQNPVWLSKVLYLHEPSTSRPIEEKAAREKIISRIVAKPSYRGERQPTPQVTVLCYHRIFDQFPDVGADALYSHQGMAVTTSTVRKQLTCALREYEPVRVADLLAAQRGELSLPERALLVTVDDGYRDFAAYGLPLMLHAGIEPVLFVRRPAADGWPLWAPLDLLYVGRGLIGESKPFPDPTWRARFLDLPLDRQFDEVEKVIGKPASQLENERRALYLSETELRSLSGAVLGCHGVNHVHWTNLDNAALDETLSGCRSWLHEMGETRLVAAYPDGAVNGKVAASLAQHGFEAAFAINRPADAVSPAFAWRRIIMRNDPEQLTNTFLIGREDVA